MRSWTVILGLMALVSLTDVAHAQMSRLDPEQPRWGQTLTITYDPAAPGAKFTAADDIYVCVRLTFPDHSQNITARMVKTGGQFKSDLKVKDNSAALAFHFITMSGGWDEQAYTTTIVFRPDGQAARGAYASKMQSGRYQEFFKREVALYPDNYSAYRAKWAMTTTAEGAKAAGIINADLKRLSRAGENAEMLCALSFGYLLTGREENSRELIRALAARFPESPFTAQAIRDYEEQIIGFQTGLPGAGGRTEIARLKQELIAANPASEFARDASLALARDSRSPLNVIEKVTQLWIKAESENPQGYFNLALACLTHYQNYERAAPLIERAIELLLAGKLRLYGDISGKQSEAMLPEAYLLDADLKFRRQRYAEAISAIKTAQVFAAERDFAAQLLEAKILQAMGEGAKAEAAFIEAWRRGSPEAEERLKEIYRRRRGSLDGFDEYLLGATKGNGVGAASASWRPAAPSVKFTSLDGKRFDLNALAGKIVVLNLWFIECGPCRKEIPRLNELVSEFSGKPVVFLAPTFDSAETLRDFLKTTPFRYQIVPNAEAVIRGQFNASSFPTHVVIDQNGLVEATLVGAAERRPEEVRRLILRLLNAQYSR